MIFSKKTKNKKGSVLVVSLMILGASLVMALSASLVAIRQKRLVMSTDNSNYAYQRAEIGVEMVMEEILKTSETAAIESIMNSDCNRESGLIELNDPVVKVMYLREYGGEFVQVNCDEGGGSYDVGDIVRMKSIGIYRRTQRAIEAPVVRITTP